MTQFEHEDEELLLCLKDLRRLLSNMRTVVETIRWEYISSILHTCIRISRRIVNRNLELLMKVQAAETTQSGRMKS